MNNKQAVKSQTYVLPFSLGPLHFMEQYYLFMHENTSLITAVPNSVYHFIAD